MQRTRAIILKTVLVRESDILLTALSDTTGTFQVLARGAKRSKKRFLGGLEIFDCGTFEYSMPKRANSSTAQLQQFNRAKVWTRLTSNLNAMSTAALLVESCCVFCALEDESCTVLFKPLYLSLEKIDTADSVEEMLAVAGYFCILLLRHSGLDAIEAFKEQSTLWFEEMMHRKCPIIPDDRDSFRILIDLLDFLEAEGHQPLRCKKEVRSIIAQAIHAQAKS